MAFDRGEKMIKDPIHQNLSTSFVNLKELIKHLHRLQFVGRVHLELSSYEADVVFGSAERVHAREYDHITGRLSEGEKALKSILTRAAEPNGRITVYPENETVPARRQSVFIDQAIVSGARNMAYGFCDTIAAGAIAGLTTAQSKAGLPGDREELKEMVLEMLNSASAAFSKQRLDFDGLFRNACRVNADRFPLIDPDNGAIEFGNGRLYVSENVSPVQLANCVSGVLGHMLTRLRESSELRKLDYYTTHKLRTVIAGRTALLDRLMIRRQFEKIVAY